MTFDDLLSRFDHVRRSGSDAMVRCPAHEDRTASLSVGERNGGKMILLYCHAGCETDAIVSATGLTMADLFPGSDVRPPAQPKLSAPDAEAFWSGLARSDDEGEAYLAGRKLWPRPEGEDLVRFDPSSLYRIAVPLFNAAGEIVNVQRRPAIAREEIVGAAFLPLAGAPLKGTTFGRLNGSGQVWIVEGQTDFLAATLLAPGLGVSVFGIPGKSNAEAVAEALGPRLAGRRVLVSLDADAKAEVENTVGALRGVGALPAVAAYAAGFKDLGELVEKLGQEGATEVMREVFETAEADLVAPLAKLLDDVRAFVRRFVVLSDAQADVVALWIAHAHALDAFDTTPFLAVTSPEKGSGKTRLLEVLELLVRRPWRVVSPSEAVLFRKITRDSPTLLLDEVDSIFGPKASSDNEGLRALLNAGNRRGTVVPRCIKKGDDIKDFVVFCARALAGIGRLPATVADRSVPIRLKKRSPRESVEPFRFRKVGPEGLLLRERLALWAPANAGPLRGMEPAMPSSLIDRAEENSEPLVAVADMAGKDWPERARRAVVEVHLGEDAEKESLGVRLLADVRRIFEERGEDRIPSEEMLKALLADQEAPWGDLRGRALNHEKLGRLLRPYGVGSKQIRFGVVTKKGYERTTFDDVWDRYLPPSILDIASDPEHPEQLNAGAGIPVQPNPKQAPLHFATDPKQDQRADESVSGAVVKSSGFVSGSEQAESSIKTGLVPCVPGPQLCQVDERNGSAIRVDPDEGEGGSNSEAPESDPIEAGGTVCPYHVGQQGKPCGRCGGTFAAHVLGAGPSADGRPS